MKWAHRWLFVALLGLGGIGEAWAADDKAEASRLLNEGNKQIRAGRPADALSLFQQAYDTFPSAKIRLNMAEAYRQLGDLGAAVREYERFVDETDEPAGKLAQAAEERVRELEGSVGRFDVKGERGDTVWVDRSVIGTLPMHTFAVQPGLRTVEVGPGRSMVELRVEAVAGKTTFVDGSRPSVDLKVASPTPAIPSVEGTSPPAAAVEPPTKVKLKEEPEDDGLTTKWWFWATVAAVAVGAGVGVAAATSGSVEPLEGELGTTRISDGWTRL